MRYRLIKSLQTKAIPVQQSCRIFGVSRAGYDDARCRSARPLLCKAGIYLNAAFTASHRSYGSRRLVRAPATQGIQIGRDKTRRLMRQAGLKPVRRRKFIPATDSNHTLPITQNILVRQFNPDRPNVAFVTDMTTIRTGNWAARNSALPGADRDDFHGLG